EKQRRRRNLNDVRSTPIRRASEGLAGASGLCCNIAHGHIDDRIVAEGKPGRSKFGELAQWVGGRHVKLSRNFAVHQDIDTALDGWEFKPGVVQARVVQTRDGRDVLQMRVDLGILQIEPSDRPDGTRPHGLPTYFDYLKKQAAAAERAGRSFSLTEEQCMEA